MTQLSRRTLLAAGAATVVAANGLRWATADASTTSPAGDLPDDPFTLGVCAGDPDASSAVLWTRLTGADGAALAAGDVAVTWELAADPDFSGSIASGDTVAAAADGHSVHVVVDVDAPSWYRFRAGPWTSTAGRVAPAGGDTLRLATTSCQHFETGYYTAHRDLAEWAPDLVVFLGDFIYEGASQPIGDDRVRSHRGDEPRDLDAYRDRYAQYLGDADLQAARAVAPWLVIWDDHEVENNYAGLTSEDDDPVEVFRSRRLAAYQAWWEHMPVRIPRPQPDAETIIYRTVSWGPLADFILLDGRQYRSDQACGDAVLDLDPACPEASDPARTMLGAEQEQWLGGQLAASAATWPVITQQTVVTDIRLPNGAVVNYDQWDGYAPARDRMLFSAAVNTPRTIVLTGDIHLAAVGLLPGVGIEFVSASISSGGLVPADFEAAVTDFPRVVGAELAHRGYTRHTVDAARWLAEFRIVDDVTDPSSAVRGWQSFAVDPETRDAVTTVGVG